MRIGKKQRVVLDVALTIMIVFEMFIQYTGEFLHEVVGFAFFATVITHLAFSAAWMRNTAKMAKAGKMTGRRIALAVMGCLLAVDMLVLGVSSVAISGIIASTGFVWPLGSYALWASVHSVSSYLLCALVVIHLAMHWAFLASAFKVPYNPDRRRAIGVGIQAVAAVGAVALGVAAAGELMPQAMGATPEADNAASNAGSSAGVTSEEKKGFSNPVSDRPEPLHGGGKTAKEQSIASSSANEKETPSAAPSEVSADDAVDLPGGEELVIGGSEEELPSNQDNEPSVVSGICTLCRKQCPLSNPRCDKPYQAGLL